MFDVPVFWPILLCYWLVLLFLTMKRQIMHMVKYKYLPFNLGKQVSSSKLYNLLYNVTAVILIICTISGVVETTLLCLVGFILLLTIVCNNIT